MYVNLRATAVALPARAGVRAVFWLLCCILMTPLNMRLANQIASFSRCARHESANNKSGFRKGPHGHPGGPVGLCGVCTDRGGGCACTASSSRMFSSFVMIIVRGTANLLCD